MTDTALTEQQHREVKQVSELAVRRYFDYYLENVWPKQQERLERHCRQRLETHNTDSSAHGGVEWKLNRFVWIGIGIAIAGGGGGFGLARLLSSLAGG
jgi:hypothetical protein